MADRFGWWPKEVSVWGDWSHFLEFTALINPWFPASFINPITTIATALEVILGLCLLLGYKTRWTALISAFLLLIFGLSMSFSLGVKSAFDYSVFTAAAAAFALSTFREKFLEIDSFIKN